jgi:UDP-3-O-[3-hydroxymyristoyl] glucosamine N-acyltransferase
MRSYRTGLGLRGRQGGDRRGHKDMHSAHFPKRGRIAERCIIGQNVNADGGATIGNNARIQNNVPVCAVLVIEGDEFFGPFVFLRISRFPFTR